MSREDFKGAAYAVAVFMETAKAEIAADRAAGKPRGARILWARANPAKMAMGWFRRRLWAGNFDRGNSQAKTRPISSRGQGA